jgi:hypothetical protein
MRKDYTINFLCKKDGSWYNCGLKRVVHGTIYVYKINDIISGEWILNVKILEKEEKAIVIAPTSEHTTFLHDQLKRKSMVWNMCKDCKKFYHPLSIAYLKNNRLHSKRIENLAEVPEEIQKNFYIKTYDEVSSKKSKTLKGKLVAVEDDPMKMAILFFLEKIQPIFF